MVDGLLRLLSLSLSGALLTGGTALLARLLRLEEWCLPWTWQWLRFLLLFCLNGLSCFIFLWLFCLSFSHFFL